MKCVAFIFFLLCSALGYSQIKVPAGFYLIKGESPVGRDDYFKNNYYKLTMDTPFQSDGMSDSDTENKVLLADIYGLAFSKTKDGMFYGTGYVNKKFKYIIIAKGFGYILSSPINDEKFSDYSKWLINTIRYSLRSDKEIYFIQ